MSIMIKGIAPTFSNNGVFNIEMFDSADELVRVNRDRNITSSSFNNMSTKCYSKDFEGTANYDEAMELFKNGYPISVERIKKSVDKSKIKGINRKIHFLNDLEGFAPIVPLALMNVPQAMFSVKRDIIKNKVINVYYDMTCRCSTSTEEITKSSCEMLSALIELEKQGYKFNIYSIITFYSKQDYSDFPADILMVKIKNSNTPLNIQRLSFTLTHPAFFRVISFDWYSKFPKGRHRSAYGHAIAYDFNNDDYQKGMRELTKDKNGIFFSCAHNLSTDKNHYMEVITNANK